MTQDTTDSRTKQQAAQQPPKSQAKTTKQPAKQATGKAADAKAVEQPTQEQGDELTKLRKELAAAEDKHLRLLAEVENFKRRMSRDKDSLAHEVLARIIKDLLCVLDSFDKGKASTNSDDAYLQGMKLVEEQFRTVLANAGLQPIKAVGEPFDPNKHQAIQRVAVSSAADNDRIQTELAKGYTLNGRLLRPSMVSVGVYEST